MSDEMIVQDTTAFPYFFGERSENIDQLAAALVAAHVNGLSNVGKDAKNPHYGNKYATLAAIVEAVGPALHKAGLAVIQLVNGPGLVKTVLVHTSGQYVASQVELPPVKPDPQAAGSAITYARRYALPAILGVATDEDDDGNAASAKQPDPPPAEAPKPEPPKSNLDKRTQAFFDAMEAVETEYIEVLKAAGDPDPYKTEAAALLNVLGVHGYVSLSEVKESKTRRDVHASWVKALERLKEFVAGGVK